MYLLIEVLVYMEDPGENLRLRSMAIVGAGDVLYVSKASLR
jgi:hypothetical protein